MTELERKAALALRPYMSKDPVIVDAGSNKGDWSDIFAGRVSEIHLFEPNEIFLHYSMVRFCEHKGMFYYGNGLSDEAGLSEFYYFTNSNNGLSSIFYNQFWVDQGLPMKKGSIRLTTLDNCFNKDIDYLKIDVEGADFKVLKGASRLLDEKKIRFIQVEHSDHIKLSGNSWGDLVAYMESKGYFCYDFTGLEFVRTDKYTEENYYFMGDFTQDWNREFKESVKLIPKQFKSQIDYQNYHFSFCLEIGAFEGLTTCYICDNLLSPDGRVIVIDPLPDDHNTLPFGEDNKIFEGQYDRFVRNTTGKPVELMRMESREAFKSKGFSYYRFDFIYIDGDHRADAVYLDGANSLNVCKKGGFILFDDYEWREETKAGIDRFLNEYMKFIEVVQMGYQVMVKKIEDVI
jgi:FkbM family methyltransferase